MRRPHIKLLLAAGFLTGIYVLALTFNITPWLRGPEEWRWAYVIPGSFSRLWLPALVLSGYTAFVIWWRSHPDMPHRTPITLVVAGIMTVVIQMSLLYLEHDDVKSQLFYRTVSESSGGFFNIGAVVTDNVDFLATFVERMPDYPVHPQRHPPGIPLLFAWTRQFLDALPDLARRVSNVFRPYQCHNLPLMNLPNSAIGGAIIQMLVPIGLAIVVWPLYGFGRRAYNQTTAWRAVLFWPIIPSIALWTTRWNQLYALFTLVAFLLLYLGLKKRRLVSFLLLGFVISLALFFSFGNAVIIGFIFIYAVIWLSVSKERPSLGWWLGAGILFLAGLSAIWIILWLFYGLNPLDLWNTATGTHLALSRSYITWLFFHLYDFFVFLGIPLFVAWLGSLFISWRGWRQGNVDILAATFAIGILALNISGTSRGETARVWAFLLPLVLLISVRYIPREGIVYSGLVILLVLQLFVSNIFLRPVGTGLTNPPPVPVEDAPKTDEILASWTDGPILHEVTFPDSTETGQPISISATWSTSEQIDRPYTIFVHLMDDQGQLVAQYDGMPLNGQWLTNMLAIGESICGPL